METTDYNKPRRRTRQQETKNYKEMNSGGRSNQTKRDDEDSPLRKELDWMKKELDKANHRETKVLENNLCLEEKIDIMKIQIEKNEEQEAKCKKDIAEMAHLNRDLTEQNKKLKTQLETTQKITPPADATTRKTISFITDSRQKIYHQIPPRSTKRTRHHRKHKYIPHKRPHGPNTALTTKDRPGKHSHEQHQRNCKTN